MSRISNTFNSLKKTNRKALVAFVMAGDPGIKTSAAILQELVKNGADIVEIGMPFSEPMADGKAIQAAGIRALEGGTTLAHILELVREFRKSNDTTPIVLMGYINPIFHMGMQKFCTEAKSAGVDGLIIVDMPPEEEEDLTTYSKQCGIDFIRLIAPTSKGARLKSLAESSSGFIYYVSVAGTTGGKSADISTITPHLAELKSLTDLPICIGFGIRTAEHVKSLAPLADGVVVGSALVETIASATGNEAQAAGEFIADLSKAL